MAKLNGIEVPTKGRIVWVRSSAFGPEYPAIVIDGVDLAPCLFAFAKEMGLSGPSLSILHESMNPAPGMWRWRWPPREEQPAAEPPCCPGECVGHAAPPLPAAVVTALGEAQPSLEERVRQLEALIDEEPTANDKQKERLQRQLEAQRANTAAFQEERAELKKRLEVKVDVLNFETRKRLQLEEANQKLREQLAETKRQLAANDAYHVEQFAAETRRATTLVEERDALRLRLAEVERERDEARERSRIACQTIIESIGSDGPESAPSAAPRE